MAEKRYLFFMSFVVNILLAFIVFGYFIVRENGIFSLFSNFNNQQISFNILANKAIKSGKVFWNWNIDIGTNFIGAFSFYNLGSSFLD